jgi:PLP dependent protein
MSDPAQPLIQHIIEFCSKIPESVRIIAVTKQVSIEAMREAYQAGIRDFGENRVQEAEEKAAQITDLPGITWHLIGHLQSNKVQRAIERFDWIQSVDSLKLAQRLDRFAESCNRTPQVCLQVKLLPDPNKFGWNVDELLTDLPKLAELEHLQIRGLMSIAPLDLKKAELSEFFHKTRELAEKVQHLNLPRIQMDQLSMGMSDDYPLAIEAGATMIRPGRVLFGERVTGN